MTDLDLEFERACTAYDGANFETLPERDRVLVTIWAIESEVNNGGFDQFYYNSAGDVAFYAPAALEAIGAQDMARIASRANAVFGPDGPPRDWAERQERLLEISDESEDVFDQLDRAFWEYPDDIAKLLIAYLER